MKEFDQKTLERLQKISDHADGSSCGCDHRCYGTNKDKAAELLYEWTRTGIFGKKAFIEALSRLGIRF